jgi:uncharacterized protein YciI
MPYFLLFYETADNYVERRAPYRAQHLELAREAHARGELLMAGALAEPADRAVLVFRAPDREAVEQFAKRDPYVLNGAVRRWEVRPWTVVIGNEPAEPGPTPPPAGR